MRVQILSPPKIRNCESGITSALWQVRVDPKPERIPALLRAYIASSESANFLVSRYFVDPPRSLLPELSSVDRQINYKIWRRFKSSSSLTSEENGQRTRET